MATDMKSARCGYCRKMTLHVRHRTSETMGCLLSILTCGLYIPIWLIMSLVDTSTPYRCNVCGKELPRRVSNGLSIFFGLIIVMIVVVATILFLMFAL